MSYTVYKRNNNRRKKEIKQDVNSKALKVK